MLRILTPVTPLSRLALDSKEIFNTGQWVVLDLDGKAKLAGPTDIGLEQISMGNLKTVSNRLKTVYGLYIGETDQYIKHLDNKYSTDAQLTVRDGMLDIATENDRVIALVETMLPNGFLRFKRV